MQDPGTNNHGEDHQGVIMKVLMVDHEPQRLVQTGEAGEGL